MYIHKGNLDHFFSAGQREALNIEDIYNNWIFCEERNDLKKMVPISAEVVQVEFQVTHLFKLGSNN
jgi:hypothetical protein